MRNVSRQKQQWRPISYSIVRYPGFTSVNNEQKPKILHGEDESSRALMDNTQSVLAVSYCGRVMGLHQTTNIFLIVSNDFQCRVKDSRLTEVDFGRKCSHSKSKSFIGLLKKMHFVYLNMYREN